MTGFNLEGEVISPNTVDTLGILIPVQLINLDLMADLGGTNGLLITVKANLNGTPTSIFAYNFLPA